MNAQEFHIEIKQEGQNPLALLEQACGLSRSEIKQAMEKGAVWLQKGKQAKPLRRTKRQLQPGHSLHFYYNPKVLAQQAKQAELLEDERDFSVWLKPSGMRSHGSRWGDHCSLVRAAEKHLQRDAFIIHRLDQAASGLILLAHNKKAAASLSDLFARRKISKRYRIIVEGQFPAQPQHCEDPVDGKQASSHFRLIDKWKQQYSLLDVCIDTGRKHQVRVHAARLGYPVVGDRLHGHADCNSPNLQLCAYQLAFEWQHQAKLYQVPELSRFLDL